MSIVPREESVLVVVDAQPGFLPEDDPAARTALARIAWLVAVARHLSIPVVVTEEEPERHGATAAAVTEQLPPDAAVYRKPTFGLAATPEILAAVRETGRPTAVIVGAETDVCVAQSAIGLQADGVSCVVVEDAVYSPGEMHELGLARILSAGVERNHAKGLTYEWLRSVADADALLASDDLPPAPFRL